MEKADNESTSERWFKILDLTWKWNEMIDCNSGCFNEPALAVEIKNLDDRLQVQSWA